MTTTASPSTRCRAAIFALWSRPALAEDAGVTDSGAAFSGIALAYNARSREEVDAVLAEAGGGGRGAGEAGPRHRLGRLFGLFRRSRRAPLGGGPQPVLDDRGGWVRPSRLIGAVPACTVSVEPAHGVTVTSARKSGSERWRCRKLRPCRNSVAPSAAPSCASAGSSSGGWTAISAKNSKVGDHAFFDVKDFPWVPGIEADWKKVRAELDALLPYAAHMPNFQDLSKEQKNLSQDDGWKTYLLLRLRHQGRRKLQALPGDGEAPEEDPRHEDGVLLDPCAGQAPAAAPRAVQGRAPPPSRAAHPRADRSVRHPRRHRDAALGGGEGDDLRRHLRPRGVEPHRQASASCSSSTCSGRCRFPASFFNSCMTWIIAFSPFVLGSAGSYLRWEKRFEDVVNQDTPATVGRVRRRGLRVGFGGQSRRVGGKTAGAVILSVRAGPAGKEKIMNSVNDIRSHFLGYFEKNGHTRGAVRPARAAERPDADVHQCRHGPVQGLLHRPRPAAVSARRRPRRNACAPAASTTTSTMSATPRGTTPSSRCSAISPSATTSRNARSSSPGRWSTKELGLPKDRLLVTVYADDDHAFDLWKKIAGFPDHKIIRIGTSANFWQMGDTGPCGPCSEIFIDQGEALAGRPARQPGRGRRPVPRVLEPRLHAVRAASRTARASTCRGRRSTPAWGSSASPPILQGVHSNYDIDLFRALIGASVEIIGVPATGRTGASHRVIADHLRASSFLIADGVLPSNEGRGYVLRRIMRRAMRHAHLLGAEEPVLYRLVPTLVAEMGRAYPELVRAEALIRETLHPRGDALPAHARPRPDAPRRGERRPRHRRHARRRRRLPPLRHLRLPARPHRGRAEGARHQGRYRRLRARHGAAEGGGARELGGLRRGADRSDLVQAPRAAGRDRVPRLRRRGRRGRGAGDGPRHRRGGRDRGAPATRSRSSSTRPRSTPSWAARSATPVRSRATRARASPSTTCRRRRTASSSTTAGSSPAGSRSATRCGSRSTRRAGRRSAPTIPPPISFTRRSAACSARTWRRRARWSRPTGSASISRIRSRSTPTRSRASRRSPTRSWSRTRR